MASKRPVVAIDGPSGVGKSTIAERVAARLDLPYLETGAMYRALGWKLLQLSIDPTDREAVEELAANIDLEVKQGIDHRAVILLDGRPLDAGIRSPAVSEATSQASVHPGVRREMVARQRGFARAQGAVLEGRDIGSQVFPDTPFKFFLTASPEIRIARRMQQLEDLGESAIDREQIATEVSARDERDRTRVDSPLKVDASYTVLDTGRLSVDDAVDAIVSAIG